MEMGGLPKRTRLRSSPEDAEHYRRHHDAALDALRNGIPREQLLRELGSCGVPEKTAERIVAAVEQEKGLGSVSMRDDSKKVSGVLWGMILMTLLIVAGNAAYFGWRWAREGSATPGNFSPSVVIGGGLAGFTFLRRLLKTRDPADPE